jgi:hypothetical protein
MQAEVDHLRQFLWGHIRNIRDTVNTAVMCVYVILCILKESSI